MSICRWPDHALVIDPQGSLKPCCMIGKHELHQAVGDMNSPDYHISTNNELDEFPYTELNMHIRKSLEKNGIKGTDTCHNCFERIGQGDNTHADAFEWLNPDFVKYESGTVSYLEFTTSNTCNQTCVMCSSYFSSKWATIDHLFGNESFDNMRLSDSDIEKIMELLPNLHILHIKGGEPFADVRNAKILERLAEVNPDCTVWFTSNCSLISKRFMDVLKKFKKVEIVASLDHIGKKYEWIRGTSFQKTLDMIERLNGEIGVVPKVIPTVSYFNILDMKEINDFYSDLPGVYIGQNGLKSYNLLFHPYEMSYLNTRTQDELDTVGFGLVSEFNQKLHDELYKKIDIMNGLRGFEWQSL